MAAHLMWTAVVADKHGMHPTAMSLPRLMTAHTSRLMLMETFILLGVRVGQQLRTGLDVDMSGKRVIGLTKEQINEAWREEIVE